MARVARLFVAILAIAAIAVSVWQLRSPAATVAIEAVSIGRTPATVYRPAGATAPGPAVVVAHGFAGSRVLMEPFAVALARNGYVAVTFDFLGHGENPLPLTGDVTEVEGATRALMEETGRVADFARSLEGTDGRIAVLGHSMASDIVVRFANERPDVAATVAVSMFSPAVTATAPRNLLVIVGDWEGALKDEALRAVGLATAPSEAVPGVTTGSFADGTARRVAFSDNTEHVAVLYSRESLGEAVAWMDAAFGVDRTGPPEVARRLPWLGLLFAGIVALGWPLSRLLPVVAARPLGAGLPWRRLWPAIVVPAVLTPALLLAVPTDFLPVVVGDYLAVHFLAYGAVTAAMLAWLARRGADPSAGDGSAVPADATDAGADGSDGRTRPLAFVVALLAVTAWGLGALGLAIDAFVTSFVPIPERLPLIGAMLVGTLSYFLATEWATRGARSGRAAAAAGTLTFLLSLALAVALDFERLFFLLIILPVIVPFFLVYGLFGRWAYRRTNHPLVGAVANAVVFAWAIGVTFPMLAG